MEKKIGNKRGILEVAVPIGAVLVVAHTLAVVNDWYRSTPWIDIFIHYGWTVVLGLFVYLVIEHFPGHVNLDKNLFATIIIGLSLASLGGVLWEFGEFLFDVIGRMYNPGANSVQLGQGDTLKDLFFDILGGFTVAVFAWVSYHKEKK